MFKFLSITPRTQNDGTCCKQQLEQQNLLIRTGHVSSFIPHCADATISVLGALGVATACLIPGSPAREVTKIPDSPRKLSSVERLTSEMRCVLELNEQDVLKSAALLRTTRKLMDGPVFAKHCRYLNV